MADAPGDLARLMAARFAGAVEAPAEAGPPAAEGLVHDLLGRSSVRRFRADPVPEPLMATLFAAAFSAPSKSDLQQASVVRLADPARRRAVADLVPQSPWVAGAPELLIFLADGRRFPRVAALSGRPFANDHLDAFFNATVDAAIVMTCFLLAAESVGLGGCPVSEVRDQASALADLLDLPDRVVPLAGLALGWPAEEAERRVKARLPLSLTVHTDRYDDGGLAAALARYDAATAAADPRPAARQRAVERFGVADRYGWSEDRTRQYATPARADFGQFVRAKGFYLD